MSDIKHILKGCWGNGVNSINDPIIIPQDLLTADTTMVTADTTLYTSDNYAS